MSIFEEAAPVGTDDRAAASADPAGALRGFERKDGNWMRSAYATTSRRLHRTGEGYLR